MQDYEQYTRISRAPVILPPAGASAAGEEEPKAEQETTTENQPENQPEEEFHLPTHDGPVWQTVRLAGAKGSANRLLLMQTLICAAILIGLLLTRSAAPEAFEQIRNWYGEAMSRVITVSVTPPEQTQPEQTISENTTSQVEVTSESEASTAQSEESSAPASSAEGEG